MLEPGNRVIRKVLWHTFTIVSNKQSLGCSKVDQHVRVECSKRRSALIADTQHINEWFESLDGTLEPWRKVFIDEVTQLHSWYVRSRWARSSCTRNDAGERGSAAHDW